MVGQKPIIQIILTPTFFLDIRGHLCLGGERYISEDSEDSDDGDGSEGLIYDVGCLFFFFVIGNVFI